MRPLIGPTRATPPKSVFEMVRILFRSNILTKNDGKTHYLVRMSVGKIFGTKFAQNSGAFGTELFRLEDPDHFEHLRCPPPHEAYRRTLLPSNRRTLEPSNPQPLGQDLSPPAVGRYADDDLAVTVTVREVV